MRDDLADMAFDMARNAMSGVAGTPEERDRRERIKQQWREERRRRREAEGWRSLIAVGVGMAVGGITMSTGIFAPAAVGMGLLAGGATAYGLRGLADRPDLLRGPQRRPEIAAPTVDEEGLSSSRAQLVKAVLDEATAHLRTLDDRAGQTLDRETAATLAKLVATGQRICNIVAAQPDGFGVAQRILTYHLPKAVYLADTLKALETAARPDDKRIIQARHVLARMENLFEKTEIDLKAGDAREMDVEIRLINEALDEDLSESGVRKG
jgi:5-bromo-4-chloroindolyl phosphate hydrolysis protein